MSTPAKRRLMKDLKTLLNESDQTIFATPFEDNIQLWCAVILGPPGTIFEGGTFSLTLKFKDTYPINPPEIKFISKMFHPNIYEDGSLCLDLLQMKWSPTYDVYGILVSIQSLLDDPNVNSPANTKAADLFTKDYEAYKEKVRETVKLSWMDVI